jgi:hypothetical protein
MATSTNYLWTEPNDSDLVKNGASAIRTLGNAIDTSLWNSGYGQAGKNKIINGDFAINQRAFTTTTTSSVYTYDRFVTRAADGTSTFTANTFTPGAAPVAGYESTNFLSMASTGQTLTSARTWIGEGIEDVRTFAGQTVTVSFYAKAASGTPTVAAFFSQVFGSGGSATVDGTGQKVTISSSFVRYSMTFSVPSVSGKTIGTSSYLRLFISTSAGADWNTNTASQGIQTATISIWGIQAEYGSYATPFQTASGGSSESELAMCQRYFQRFATGADATNEPVVVGQAYQSTGAIYNIQTLRPMRVTPTMTLSSATHFSTMNATATDVALTALSLSGSQSTTRHLRLDSTVASGLVAGSATFLRCSSASATLDLSSEL